MNLAHHKTPKWFIFLIDLAFVLFAVILAYLLRFNFTIPENELLQLPKVAGLVLLIRGISFLASGSFAGILRYTSTRDAARIFLVLTSGSVLFVIMNLINYYAGANKYVIPFSIIVIEFITSTLLMTAFRVLVKIAFIELSNPSREKQSVVIIGAGDAGIITKRALERDAGTKFKIEAFIDDDPNKIGKKLEDVRIYPGEKLDSILEDKKIYQVIIAIQNLKNKRRQEFIETAIKHDTKIMAVPPVSKWINGELSFNQIKKINIEDLLGRDIIRLEEDKIRKELLGKTIMITGAAGSIGSELVRQVLNYNPERLVLIDQAESPLYHLDLELQERNTKIPVSFHIADIRNTERMTNLFRLFKPHIVYHAAAYKHVPLMEENPSEAINTNIIGTRNIAQLAIKCDVQKFIMISTDKAVKPTSVMGASKRFAEIYTQSLNRKGNTVFIITRFGNVLGSNGSVIPLFRKQIEKGGPLTITHPEITRFFMTIPEACQLVLEAGTMGKGGEIFIFDMGKSIKILDLAKNMIRLSGLTLGKDIQIKYTGLRPGEKLYEELLNDAENTLPTHHPQIMIAKDQQYDLSYIEQEINELAELLEKQEDQQLIKKLKTVIPEYKSKNSIFEKLD